MALIDPGEGNGSSANEISPFVHDPSLRFVAAPRKCTAPYVVYYHGLYIG